MTELRFYHLQRKTLEQALPQILAKVIERGWRAVILAGSPERVEALNQHLWTWDRDSFLPHGSAADGDPENQPIWLTATEENPNRANVLLLVDGALAGQLERWDLVCDLFDGNDPEALAAARSRWRTAKSASHTLTYWQQSDRGAWERKV
ncbi:MAG: DNA polymerase III subunit chi [Azospirillum sp.]|nr:DNA polymerase III subunit chi [Azospirillum sp.]